MTEVENKLLMILLKIVLLNSASSDVSLRSASPNSAVSPRSKNIQPVIAGNIGVSANSIRSQNPTSSPRLVFSTVRSACLD
jgi:hypothetical protein